MKALIAVGGKLAIICTVAALVLALVDAVTAPVIQENRERALREGLELVARDAPVADVTIGQLVVVDDHPGILGAYPVLDSDGASVGLILQVVGDGYGGDMEMLTGFERSGRLFSAKLMKNQETPGLGKKAEDPAYMSKFLGSGGEVPVPRGRSDLTAEEADAITGATITFLGVANAIRAGAEFSTSFQYPGSE